MFSFFKKKKVVSHIKLSGVIGNVGKFKEGIDFSGQEEIIKKALVNLNSISLKQADDIVVKAEKKEGESNQIVEFTREIKKTPMEFRFKIIAQLTFC